MSESLPPRPDAAPPASPQKNNRLGVILIAGVLLCCACLGALLVGQYLLENSDFTLVKLLIAHAAA